MRHFGHPVAEPMQTAAEDIGMLPVWREQALNDAGAKTAHALRQLQSGNRDAASLTSGDWVLFSGFGTFDEHEPLEITKNDITERSRVHSRRIGFEPDEATLAEFIERMF